MNLGDTQYGIYWLKDKEIHRNHFTRTEAIEWMEEAVEIFPDADVYKVWGICQAQWVLTDQ